MDTQTHQTQSEPVNFDPSDRPLQLDVSPAVEPPAPSPAGSPRSRTHSAPQRQEAVVRNQTSTSFVEQDGGVRAPPVYNLLVNSCTCLYIIKHKLSSCQHEDGENSLCTDQL